MSMARLSPTERMTLRNLGVSEREFAEMDKVTMVQAVMAVCTDLPVEVRHALSDYLTAILYPPPAEPELPLGVAA
jgi:hypothetical protein